MKGLSSRILVYCFWPWYSTWTMAQWLWWVKMTLVTWVWFLQGAESLCLPWSSTDRVLTLNMNIWLPLFWSTWSGAWGQDLAKCAGLAYGCDFSYCRASEPKSQKVLGHCFSLNCQKCLKNSGPEWGFSTLSPQTAYSNTDIFSVLYKVTSMKADWQVSFYHVGQVRALSSASVVGPRVPCGGPVVERQNRWNAMLEWSRNFSKRLSCSSGLWVFNLVPYHWIYC